MPTEERTAFKERLQQDAAFKTQVQDIKLLLCGVEEQALKEKLDEFHDEMPIRMETQKKASKVRQFQFMKIAAAAVIVIAAGCFWFLNGSSNERLYDNYFKPDPGLPTTMSSSDNFAFFDAMVNYKQGDYKTAIKKWEKLEQIAPKNDTITYFLGVANLADKNTSEAIDYLNRTVDVSKSVFREDAYYYLGLAYLKSDNIEEATQAFQKSQSENSKEILKDLKWFHGKL